jgi:hypothetical protein
LSIADSGELKVLLSHKSSGKQDDPLEGISPEVDLPRLNVGEYLLVLRAEEVISSFTPINPLGFYFEPKPHFNYFILRDNDNHTAWPIGSPEEQYITSLFSNAVRSNVK